MTIKTIPERNGYYITGFTDGEGSFNVSFRKRNDFLIGWKITPVFNISQDERKILGWIKHILKCGTIRKRKDGVYAFEVSNRESLKEYIIPFFDRFCFQSDKKKLQFQRFKQIFKLITNTRSLTYEHIKQILIWRNESNPKIEVRRYNDIFVLQRAEYYWNKNKKVIKTRNNLKESSETNTPNEDV